MKTAVTVLQEMMTKLGQTPEYECISQSGPAHLSTFEYRCKAHGLLVTATARSKKEAKQEVARQMLMKMARRGDDVPPPYNCIELPTPAGSGDIPKKDTPGASGLGSHKYVALLNDLCEEYHLPGAEYELVGDSGPPHMRAFTWRVRIGSHERYATSSTKKAARQMAAEQLYTYMRENLGRLTKDFVEEEALARIHERAMERYVELRDPEVAWRPDLGQRIADYHLGLKTHSGPEKVQLALNVLSSLDEKRSKEPEVLEAALVAAVEALGLTLTFSELAADREPLTLIELTPTAPALAFAGEDRPTAVFRALQHLRLALE